MKRHLLLATALTALLVTGGSHAAKAGTATETVIRGEVVDLICYLADAKKKGKAHEACAREGIAAGNPVGILTKTGEVYLVIGRDAKWIRETFTKYAGKRVAVTGKRISRGRMRAILATNVVSATPTSKK